MGTRTDAARAEVLAARESLGEELIRLEASGRAAVDIPARLRREPAKVAGTAAGAAFLLLGGPGRLVRSVRRAVLGPDAELPKSMLPPEVEKTLKKLGADGEKVRGTLEREFADYLEEKAPARKERDLGAVAGGIMASLLKPVSIRLGRQLAERMLNPDGPSFADGLRRARARTSADSATAGSPASSGTSAAEAPPPGAKRP